MLLAFMGPGIIAANAGNDAGGIVTYASAGAQFGYRTLFVMVLVTVALVVVQEMCARLGAYTGEGLGALIREQFSIRVTAFALAALIVANVGLVVSEFAGIARRAGAASRLEIHQQSRSPAAAIWALVVFGSYKYAERLFLVLSLVFFAYPVAAFLSRPDYAQAGADLAYPHFLAAKAFLLLVVALIGTTITPYMQFYVAAAVADQRHRPGGLCRREARHHRRVHLLQRHQHLHHHRHRRRDPRPGTAGIRQAGRPGADAGRRPVRLAAVRRRAPRCQRAGRRGRPAVHRLRDQRGDRRRAQRQQVLPPGAAVPWPVHRTGLRRGRRRADPRQPDPAPGRRPGPERAHHAHPADVRPGPRQPQQRPRRRRERPRLQGRRHDQRHRRRDPLGDRARAIGPGRTGYRLIQRTAAALEPAAVR